MKPLRTCHNCGRTHRAGYWIGRSDEASALLVEALPYLPADLRSQAEKFLRRPPCKEPTP